MEQSAPTSPWQHQQWLWFTDGFGVRVGVYSRVKWKETWTRFFFSCNRGQRSDSNLDHLSKCVVCKLFWISMNASAFKYDLSYVDEIQPGEGSWVLWCQSHVKSHVFVCFVLKSMEKAIPPPKSCSNNQANSHGLLLIYTTQVFILVFIYLYKTCTNCT